MARAFVQQPKLLLLDEPTSNLDLRNQYEMMKLVCHRFLFVKNGLVYDYGNASIVTEQALGDVYGICATLLTCHNKKFAIME